MTHLKRLISKGLEMFIQICYGVIYIACIAAALVSGLRGDYMQMDLEIAATTIIAIVIFSNT